MDFMLNWAAKPLPEQIDHTRGIVLTGSCFTEHIGNSLHELKFNTLQNPNGILFDTLSVCRSLTTYIDAPPVDETQLFQLNEAWHHWQYHSRFSHPQQATALEQMNSSRHQAHAALKQAGWLIITLGSSFAYRLTEVAEAAGAGAAGAFVANCHKAPAQWFTKYLTPIDEQVAALDAVIRRLRSFNSGIKIILTVSPVRHIRDGVVENNRSKARLLETVHHLVSHPDHIYYFPSYELVIDILRDYRFYDIDMVHPNYMATSYVLEQFISTCITPASTELIEALKPLAIARRHKPFNPHSEAHQKFMRTHLEKTQQLQQRYPFLNLSGELEYFANGV